MPVEAVTPYPPRRVGRAVSTLAWGDVAFLHWQVPPARVAGRLPPGVHVDALDGVSYVGLVALAMRRITVGRGPALPYLGSFLETNVRLYTVDDAGRRGVWFLSMDASRLAAVLVGRWAARLPYRWSRMRLARHGADRVEYGCRRRWPGPRGTHSRLEVRVGRALEPGPVEHFVTARWGLHLAGRPGRTRYWPNEHPPWRLRAAAVQRFDDRLLAAAGFADLAATPPVSVLFSDGAHVAFGAPRPI
jgi:uncharacterized protein YqjF (DUF2071 family)